MELLQYTVLDFILFFGAYMGGVILHELCHLIAGKVLAQNVSMSLFGLRVEYDVPTENVARIRWISLSPLLLAILIVTFTFALGIVDNLFIWLVVIGLVINTSSSDLSIRKALGETIFTDDIHRSLKIGATGLFLHILSMGIPRLETSTYGQELFIHYVGSSFQAAGILLMVVGVAIYFYDDVHQLKNSATSDE